MFTRLFEQAEIARFTPDESRIYEESLKHYRDLRNVINSAERRGREEGREEGRAEGRAEGIAEGRAEGIAETRLSNAKSLLANGIALDMIVKSLSLTSDEVNLLSQRESV